MKTFDDLSKVAEVDWHAFLQNGKPVVQAGLHVTGMANLPTGIQLHYHVFRLTFGGQSSDATAQAGPQAADQPSPSAPVAAAAAAASVPNGSSGLMHHGWTSGTGSVHPLQTGPPSQAPMLGSTAATPTTTAAATTAATAATAVSQQQAPASQQEGPHERVLMIMGFAAPADAWLPLLHQMQRMAARQMPPCSQCTLEVCTFDNRGIGKSTVPASKKVYTTDSMAVDALGLMDTLGWETAHVVGFSMGGMIATKLASHAPHRVRSLTLVSVTGGNWQVLPLTGAAFRTALKGLLDKSNKGRAKMDVKFHFARATRRAHHNGRSIGAQLIEEYIKESETNGRQPQAGEDGHLHAVWNHEVTDADVHNIKSARLPVTVIHGVHDLMAQCKYGRRMATRLGARLVLVDGGHFTPRENAAEIAQELLGTVFAKAGLEWRAPGLRRPLFAGDAAAAATVDDPLLAGRGQEGGLAACFVCCA